MPQAFKPAIELALNKNTYFGTDIVSEKLMFEDPENQVYSSTPQIYRDIGKGLGLSPLRVQHLIRGYTAGGGDGALVMADLLRGKETGGRSTPEQLVNRFRVDASKLKGEEGMPGGQIASSFYDSYIPLSGRRDSKSAKITDTIKAGDEDTANKMAVKVNEDIDREIARLVSGYGATQRDVSGYVTMLEDLKLPVENGKLSPQSIEYRKKLKR